MNLTLKYHSKMMEFQKSFSQIYHNINKDDQKFSKNSKFLSKNFENNYDFKLIQQNELDNPINFNIQILYVGYEYECRGKLGHR